MVNNIKSARISSGKSQKEVALTLHVSPPTVSEWESGKKTPTSDNLMKLADLFGVTTDYLLGRHALKNWDLQMFAADPAPQQITPPEQQLLAAYHNAPQPIRDAVDGLLAPYQKENPAGRSDEAM